MKKILLSLLVLLAGFSASAADTPKVQDEPKIQNIQSIIDQVKLQNPNAPIRLFAQGRKITVNVVTPTTPMRAHYHATHEEVVYMVRGHGKLTLGDKTQEIKEGNVIYIPRKIVHSFIPESQDCRALSIFAPAFDGKDRIFIDGKK